jgi:hypothetical protein
MYMTAAKNPANVCQTCEPAQSTAAWTTTANGVSCGVGAYCDGGECTAGCEIGTTFYPTAASNPADACQVCTPSSTSTAWSSAMNGTSCGPHDVCNLGICAPGCFIMNTFYANATTNPGNQCQVCDATASTTTWSNAANLTSCQGNQYCVSGACEQGCNINGTTYAPGASDPASPCNVCAPRENPGQWTSPCTTCNIPLSTCTIDCTTPGSCNQGGNQITCPGGLSCVVDCSETSSCQNLTITSNGPLDVECSGAQSCLNTTIDCLGAGTCSVNCTGPQACQAGPGGPQEQGLVCGTGACVATCGMNNSFDIDCGESSSCANMGCAIP